MPHSGNEFVKNFALPTFLKILDPPLKPLCIGLINIVAGDQPVGKVTRVTNIIAQQMAANRGLF